MKTFKQIKEEISNVSAGIGVRGFGDVSGTPKVGDESPDNPHIERVIQGADEYRNLVYKLIQNSTTDMHNFDDDNWWKDKKESEKYAIKNMTKGAGLEFDNVKRDKHKIGIVQEEIGGIAGTTGTTAGSGYIAGIGVPLEGKPSNWGEPGVTKKVRKKHKKRTKAKSNEVGSAMKEIPIQEEDITNTTDAAPGLGDNKEVFLGKTKQNKSIWPLFRRLPLKLNEEIERGVFAGEQTFVVPSHVFERAIHHKQKGKHWRTYIKDEEFHPAIREFAYSNLNSPIIFEDEKTGYMSYARYGKKRKK